MSNEIIADADHKMARAVEAMERDFQGIRTGRASTSLVERIHVEYYGTRRRSTSWPASASRSRTRSSSSRGTAASSGAIEKAIIKSDIGLMPNVDGTVVRLNIPPLTEERRKDLVKVVHKRMEEARVEIRNLRRDAADELKKEERDGESAPTRRIASWRCSRRRPIATSPRSTASARQRNRRSSRSSGPRAAGPTDRRAAHGADEPSRARAAGRRHAADEPDRAAGDLPRHVAIIMDGNRRWARAARPARARGPRRRRRGDPDAPRATPSGAASRSCPCTPSAARTGRAPTTRSPGLFGLLEDAIRERDRRARARRASASGSSAGWTSCPPRRGRPSKRRSTRRPAATRLLLNIAFNYAGRTELVDAVRRHRRERDRRRRDRRGRDLRRACTRPACPTPTS